MPSRSRGVMASRHRDEEPWDLTLPARLLTSAMNFAGRLVFTESLKRRVPQDSVLCPFQKLDLGDIDRLDPRDAAAIGGRRRLIEGRRIHPLVVEQTFQPL